MTYWYCDSVWLHQYRNVFIMHVLETHFCKQNYLPRLLRAGTSLARESDKNTFTPNNSCEVTYYINQQGKPHFNNLFTVIIFTVNQENK